MKTKPTILITAAGGHTGMPAAFQFLKLGYPVRTFLRREDARARRLRKAGAEVFIGNLYDFRDLRKALKGVQRAYHCQPFAPNVLHGSALFAIAADEAKLEVVAHLGAWNPHPEHTAIHQREHWIGGSLMNWMPSVDCIHINPGMFAFTYFLGLPFISNFGQLNLPYADGLNAPPSNEDIAAVAVHALMEPEKHIGKRYRPTGPRLISAYEAAEAMSDAFGRKVIYKPSSDKMFAKVALAMGFSRFEVSQVHHYIQELRNGVFAEGGPTDHVRLVTGREPEGFESIARRYAQAPEAKRSMRAKLDGVRIMAKAALTRVPGFDPWLDDKLIPRIRNGKLAHEIPEWLENARAQQPSLYLPMPCISTTA
jgi:uncharacterized protein YbjT (DUF2867 family)